MAAYVNFGVDIHDAARYTEFMTSVKPDLAEAGACYLVRGWSGTRNWSNGNQETVNGLHGHVAFQ